MLHTALTSSVSMFPIVLWLAVGAVGALAGTVTVVVANRRFRSATAGLESAELLDAPRSVPVAV